MKKKLEEMTLQELWQLFPVILKKHKWVYKHWYAREKKAILRAIGSGASRISHIGSTAVKGLIAKPTVDILLEIHPRMRPENIIQRLTSRGWTLMSSIKEPELRLSFNKGYTPAGFARKVFHLHVRYNGDWGELYFRDYLRHHKITAAAYARLKQNLLATYRNNRDGYTEAKSEFIRKYTELARQEFKGRYTP